MDIEMIIENPQEGKAFVPVVEEGITWRSEEHTSELQSP